MILIWRGWGLLAVVAFFPVLASCAGLVDLDSKIPLIFAVSGSLLLGGGGCVYFGTRWNRDRENHSLYFVPLQVWGWLYLVGAAGLSLLLLVGVVRAGLGFRHNLPQSNLFGVGLGAIILFLVVGATYGWRGGQRLRNILRSMKKWTSRPNPGTASKRSRGPGPPGRPYAAYYF